MSLTTEMEKMLGEASKTKSVYFNLKVRQFFVGHFVRQTNIKTKIASPLLQTDAEVYTSLTNQNMHNPNYYFIQKA